MTQEALKLALEALENLYDTCDWHGDDGREAMLNAPKAITAIKEVLAQTQEPVAHWSDCAVHNEPAYPKGECDCGGIVAVADYTVLSDKYVALSDKYVALKAQRTEQEPVGRFAKFTDGIWAQVTDYSAGIPLYTTPPQRTWVGLADEEREEIALEVPMDAVCITEAKLKEKNT